MELPFQTYERIMQRHWPGGRSAEIENLLGQYGISWPAGSAEANLCLQGALLASYDIGGKQK